MFEMLLGHLVGDYLLQNNYIADNKIKYNLKGWVICFIHCLIYTFFVCAFMKNFDYRWILIVFISHFFIDKFSLADKYLQLTKGRSLTLFLKSNELYQPSIGLKSGFTSMIYAIVDNTFHILLMYFGYHLLY